MTWRVSDAYIDPKVLAWLVRARRAVMGSGPRGVTIGDRRWEMAGFDEKGFIKLTWRRWES